MFEKGLENISKITIHQVTGWGAVHTWFIFGAEGVGAVSPFQPNDVWVEMARLSTSTYSAAEVVAHEVTHSGAYAILSSTLPYYTPLVGMVLVQNNESNEVQARYKNYLDDRKEKPCSPFNK